MNAYVDSSVALRVLLEQPSALAEWSQIEIGITSVLTRVECCRTLDRLVRDRYLLDEQFAIRLAEVDEILSAMIVRQIDEGVLRAASRRFGIRVDSLDAIHLATAEQYRDNHPTEAVPLFATHDYTLAIAARAVGFEVIGA